MSILEAFVVPHPPILVPGVGKGAERGARATLDAYRQVARRIAELEPELLILTTSHGTLRHDRLRISTGAGAWGDFAQFRDRADRLEVSFDEELIDALITEARRKGLAIEAAPEPDGSLDHGCMVPLYFIAQEMPRLCRVLRVAISLLDEQSHYRMGACIARVTEDLGRRAVFVASGDLSHRLTRDGSYGYHPAGPAFDKELCAALATGDLDVLMHFDARLREDAAECGLNSFIIMAGALGGPPASSELLSYEGPWGVGYAVARFTPAHGAPVQDTPTQDTSAHGAPVHGAPVPDAPTRDTPVPEAPAHSLPVRLAFAALEDWLSGIKTPSEESPAVGALIASLSETDRAELDELRGRRAGTFVSFHKQGELRGCIGTISPVYTSIFAEICHNTTSAAGEDPRFAPIRSNELALLSCSVDILGRAEPVANPERDLDAKRYGVIVTSGFRRGLLLPDLEGVESPTQQIAIALRKAGIDAQSPYELERFEVVRHR
ncbi:MAG: AmmeMemoRadiSam system protein A [Coriobacteriales bacterium]|jgi:AmmeMemoRadiSam system protein A|nr:AmmeMemoRadiSam system protein A [Coriobacteriales bacterium]